MACDTFPQFGYLVGYFGYRGWERSSKDNKLR